MKKIVCLKQSLFIVLIISAFTSCALRKQVANIAVKQLVKTKSIKKDICVMENSDGKRLVHLPMHHLGNESYFRSIKKMADTLRNQGYVVLYESMRYYEEDTLSRLKYRYLMGVSDPSAGTSFSNGGDIPKQIPKILKNVSVQSYEKIGVKPEIDIRADITIDSALFARYEREHNDTIRLTDYDYATPLNKPYTCQNDGKKYGKGSWWLTHTVREQKVYEEVRSLQDRDIVLLYGKGHKVFLNLLFCSENTRTNRKKLYKGLHGKLYSNRKSRLHNEEIKKWLDGILPDEEYK